MASAHVMSVSMCTVIFGIAPYHFKLESDKEQGKAASICLDDRLITLNQGVPFQVQNGFAQKVTLIKLLFFYCFKD